MTLERRHQRLQLGHQRAPYRHRERADHAHARQLARVPVQPEQQRPDRVGAALVRPVARHHAVRRPVVLDLEHHALVRLVQHRPRLRDQAVKPRALELAEPLRGDLLIGRRGRQVDGRGRAGQRLLERGAALGERALRVVNRVQRQQVERDEVGRRLRGQQPHPARGRVQPQLQGLEVQPPGGPVRQHDLPVDDAPGRQLGQEGGHQLGEVAGHRPLVPAADLDLVAVAEDDGPEPVPLRLEEEVPGRDRVHRLGQHRRHGRHHRKIHNHSLSRRGRGQTQVSPPRSTRPSPPRSTRRCGSRAALRARGWRPGSVPRAALCRSSGRSPPPPRARSRSTAR